MELISLCSAVSRSVLVIHRLRAIAVLHTLLLVCTPNKRDVLRLYVSSWSKYLDGQQPPPPLLGFIITITQSGRPGTEHIPNSNSTFTIASILRHKYDRAPCESNPSNFSSLLMDGIALPVSALVVALAIVAGIDRMRWSKLDYIPSVGPSGRFTSYYGAVKFIMHAKHMIQEGYEQHKEGFFKVPMIDRWVVVVSGPRLLDELRKISDEKLSFDHAMQDILQVKYTFGLEAQEHPYHVQVVREHLKRNFDELFPGVFDEICHTFDELVPSQEHGWVKVGAFSAAMKATCRASNRVFVGSPICQSTEFEKIQSKFALQVATRAAVMNLFPKILHPVIGRLLTNTPSSLRHCMEMLRPVVDERLTKREHLGENWPGKPNDMLSWLIDVSSPEDRNLRSIALRILVLNFASLHTSAQNFGHALFNLAAHPQYVEPLREEVKGVIDQYGWTRDSVSQLPKMDSFLKESQRVSCTCLTPVVRKAMEDIMFSDGTTIPTGTHVAISPPTIFLDDEYYPNSHEFDPFRFYSMRQGQMTRAQQLSMTLSTLHFGQGKRACPGRTFATTMMTTMMAYLVLNYDMKLEEDGVRPPDEWLFVNCFPNRTAEILFKKR